ncbi:SidJ-related pseudokinase [Desulfobacter hydrogenophilus]|uniref:SidJ-related pseudokinase n=2 Tax=Desulfobacter hydrogenophilus TaxID=2291 RepID=UPI001F5E59B7|nr:SidJ-related pseudokinase [Desulfobacter hydrogenophilus]
MSLSPPSSARIREEHLLINHCLDFSAAYMGVKYISQHAADYPFTVTQHTLDALFSVFETARFKKAKQAFFLYHEAACTLVDMGREMENDIIRTIVPKLMSLLMKSSGNRLRALSQALGRLADNSPAQHSLSVPNNVMPLNIDLSHLAEKFTATGESLSADAQWTWKGRSLIVRAGIKILGVIKFATTQDNITEIHREAVWMEWFSKNFIESVNHVPKPICIQGRYLFSITDELPKGGPETLYRSVCIVFIPYPGYYEYPNLKGADWKQIQSSFFKSALALGRLSSQGVFHTALIPLFHNRVQQGRRNDNGRYLWEHAGRLDQWLNSSRFPNFAASGLRDFEHIACQAKPLDLEHYTGEYLLSFILVAGSCFRNKAPHRRGTDNTRPYVNTRDLFCPDLFESLLTGVCEHYFKGLTQSETFDPTPFNIPALVEILIEKMGFDEHMQETLRVQDQLAMDDEQFEKFLTDRGLSSIPAKGKEEIILFTGPHLGEFNQSISIPELIAFLFKFSAICVSTYFLKKGSSHI